MIQEMKQRRNAVTWYSINDVCKVGGDVYIEVMSCGGSVC
jgi:hypothetical protein